MNRTIARTIQSAAVAAALWGALSLAATTVRAQTNTAPIHTSPATFKSADTNLDGRVSPAEFAEYVKKTTFEKLDANKDGMISLEEWKAVDHSPEAEKHFASMDKDKNGRISYAEFSNAPDWKSALNVSFAALDRNQKGNLTPDEWPKLPRFRLLSVDF